MAFQSDATALSNSDVLAEVGRVLTAPFLAIGRAMIYLAENNPRVHALSIVAEMTDAELAEKGLTRDQAIRDAIPHYI